MKQCGYCGGVSGVFKADQSLHSDDAACAEELLKQRSRLKTKIEDLRTENAEVRGILAYFTDDGRGHRPDGERCVEHGVIRIPHVLPCPVAEAQRLVGQQNPETVSL